MVESSTSAKDSVLANFCAESLASAISPMRPWTAPTSFEPMDAASPPMAPTIAAPLALMPLPADSPIWEPACVPALRNLPRKPLPGCAEPPKALEKAVPPVLPAPPSSLSILAAKPLMVGMMVTEAEPTLTAIYAPPSGMPRILSISPREASALARRRSASALSPGVFGGCGARRPFWPSLVHCLHARRLR